MLLDKLACGLNNHGIRLQFLDLRLKTLESFHLNLPLGLFEFGNVLRSIEFFHFVNGFLFRKSRAYLLFLHICSANGLATLISTGGRL